MLSKAKIKSITALKFTKYRRQMGLFVAEGDKLVRDFLQNPVRVAEVYAQKGWLNNHRRELGGIKVTEITVSEMRRISQLKNPSEVLALIRISQNDTPPELMANTWYLMLDGIRDPGNLGTMIRTADWFGIASVICSPDTVDVYNQKVVQASMGSVARIPVFYADLQKLLTEKPEKLPVYGTLLQGENISEIKKPIPGVILIGSEARGISEKLTDFITRKVTIPAAPLSQAESLNASVAAAVACYALITCGGSK